MSQTPPSDRLTHTLVPLAAWCGMSVGLIALAAYGPRLWATQPIDNDGYAIEIVAFGQVLAAAVAWPWWMAHRLIPVVMICGAPLWLLLAAQLGYAATGQTLKLAALVVAILATLAGLKWLIGDRPTALRTAWVLALGAALGAPALWYLRIDYGR